MLSFQEATMGNSGVREAIERLSAAVGADPAKARAKNVPATARLTEGLKFEVSGPNKERVVTDMPPPMGGGASAPTPAWFLRAGMASCTATTIAMRAAKQGIALTALEVTVESDSDLRGLLGLDDNVSAGLNPMRTKVRIGGEADPQALRALVEWADAHSPVGCTVKNAAACSLDIEVV
jgi:uncharacterized OsmC-like protein